MNHSCSYVKLSTKSVYQNRNQNNYVFNYVGELPLIPMLVSKSIFVLNQIRPIK